jgi:large subunit ribosomal protein L13
MTKEKIIIDASKAVLGRLCGYIAKQSLLGKEVIIVNIEKAIIIGAERVILLKYSSRTARGNVEKGPFFPSTPEKIAKRGVRGMLSYKKQRGNDALKRVKFYIGIPVEFEKSEKIKFEKIVKGKKYITLQRLCELI